MRSILSFLLEPWTAVEAVSRLEHPLTGVQMSSHLHHVFPVCWAPLGSQGHRLTYFSQHPLRCVLFLALFYREEMGLERKSKLPKLNWAA